MNRIRAFLIVIFFAIAGMTLPANAQAQEFEIQQLLLDWEKLAQLKNILKDMYKGYQILSEGYNAIKDLSEGNFNLHKGFLDGLLLVNPFIAKLDNVKNIISNQSALVSEYRTAYTSFRTKGQFSAEELDYCASVCSHLIQESLQDLDHLLDLMTANTMRMSDAERLTGVDLVNKRIRDKLVFLRHFNSAAAGLAAQRIAARQEIDGLRGIFGKP